jgi:hypothetical protein
MKPPFGYGFIALIAFTLGASLIGGCASETNLNAKAIAAFRSSFETASPKAKRGLVIAAIDNETITRGLPLDDVRRLFGQNLTIYSRNSQKDKLTARVFFEPVIPSGDPMISAFRAGWYIDFVFSSNDRLEYYSLSNLHK